MRKVIGAILWIPVLPLKAIFWFVGIFYVPIMIKMGKEHGPWQRLDKRRPYTYEELAWRNPADGMGVWIGHPDSYMQELKHGGKHRVHMKDGKQHIVGVDDEDFTKLMLAYPEPWALLELEQKDGWRWRWSGKLFSFRYVKMRGGGYAEFYLGWKLGSMPPALDFATSARGWWPFKARKVGE